MTEEKDIKDNKKAKGSKKTLSLKTNVNPTQIRSNFSSSRANTVVVETKRDAVPEVILNQLYKFTQLQDTFGIILLALVNGVPKIMSLKEVLNHFIDFRHDVVVKRTQYELSQAEDRAHILEGLKIALDNIDKVIELIRASKNPEAAKEGLMNGFNLSE